MPRWWTALLLPFSALYYLIIVIRNLCYRFNVFKSYTAPVPIIVVGNITVGGTGKTPLVIWLVEFLQQNGYKPGVISRGYIPKSKASDEVIMVTKDSDTTLCGDEPVLIALRTNCPVAVTRKRSEAIESLISEHQCDVIISDDGLQHYAIHRDIEIVVLDGKRRLGNKFLLPAGPLREPASRLKQVDFIVNNGGHPHRNEYNMQLIAGDAYNIQSRDQSKTLSEFVGQTLHAVAGIGNPQRFFTTLRDNNLLIVEHPYPDHYQFKRQDINFYGNLNVIMTEKDAVKCLNIAEARHWCLPVSAKLDTFFGDKILDKLKLCYTKS